ncbi:hypothetical protein NliqN6_3814 [Naganishia liquefaciens]|uniref:Uncharacterized protein n=1 Tax=Naganishia liquefaciens TaxID=104408 RepID=A0A8H3TUI2_9TREE|nr:hypothetical protein NliqN6_3814 [Naganishia liquefaciens]
MMDPAREIAPFFPANADPTLLRSAADTLRHLRAAASRTREIGDARSALPAISALLACERSGKEAEGIVSREAAQKSSACARNVFMAALGKARRVVLASSNAAAAAAAAAAGQSPSGRASMSASSSSRTLRKSPSQAAAAAAAAAATTPFDPLNLPGSSAKRVVAPIMRRSGVRDLRGLVKNKTGTGSSPDKGKDVGDSIIDKSIVEDSTAKETPSVVQTLAEETLTAPETPPRATPTTPTKSLPSPASPDSPATAVKSPHRPLPTPRRAAPPRTAARTPTGHGSPMHNALMKNRLEGASAVRLGRGQGRVAAGSARAFAGEEEEVGAEEEGQPGLPSPKRRRVGTRGNHGDADETTPRNPPPSEKAIPHVGLDALPGSSRSATSATTINALFYPLPTHPLDPHCAIPAPPLTFSGSTIFQRPPSGNRIFDRLVPPDDRAFGDSYSLMSSRRTKDPHSQPGILEIAVHEVPDAYAKRERTRKRRLRRLARMARGMAGWDREFGVPFEEDEERADVPDWEERLDESAGRVPEVTRAVMEGLGNRRGGGVVQDVALASSDREWIVRAETHGIAVRIHSA